MNPLQQDEACSYCIMQHRTHDVNEHAPQASYLTSHFHPPSPAICFLCPVGWGLQFFQDQSWISGLIFFLSVYLFQPDIHLVHEACL